jgi:hypothetical protein
MSESLLAGIQVKSFDAAAPDNDDVGTLYYVPPGVLYVAWALSFGTAPGAVQIDLEATVDGTNYFSIDSITSTAGGLKVVSGPFKALRAKQVSRTGGAEVTVTLYSSKPIAGMSSFTYDDVRVEASGINPPGAAADPTRNTTTGLLEFSGSADNIICAQTELPHDWVKGSLVYPHIHTRHTVAASANTRCKFEYDYANPNADFNENSGTYEATETITVANPNNVKRHHMSAFSPIYVGNAYSTIIQWKLTRLANSDAADNDTQVAALLALDFHYLKKFGGSLNLYTD